MDVLKDTVMYILSFKSYVLLPIVIFILAMVFRIKISTAVKSAFTIGIGFIGLFIILDYFVEIVSPVIKLLIARTGLHFNVLDVGWAPLAAITWSFSLAPLFLLFIMVVNIALLVTKFTRTVNIDIWNYWHFIFTGALVYNATGNIIPAALATIILSVITLKIADWSAPYVEKFSGLKGVSIPTFSAAAYFPVGILGDKLIDRIPFINRIEANPEKIKGKLGLAGEPMISGFVIGILLGIGSGCDVKHISELAFGIAAVIYILPKMAGIVGTSLIPVSEGMKEFIQKHFPTLGVTYIALDVSVIVGISSVVVTAVLMMPVALVLAFVLPGIKFIPLGDLVSLVGGIALICAATRGNVVRSFLIGLPIIVVHLYTASFMADSYTKLAAAVNYKLADYTGIFTSFVDGGNILRTWAVKLFSGNTAALILAPIVLLALYFTYRIIRSESK